jgi:hypothetical protein
MISEVDKRRIESLKQFLEARLGKGRVLEAEALDKCRELIQDGFTAQVVAALRNVDTPSGARTAQRWTREILQKYETARRRPLQEINYYITRSLPAYVPQDDFADPSWNLPTQTVVPMRNEMDDLSNDEDGMPMVTTADMRMAKTMHGVEPKGINWLGLLFGLLVLGGLLVYAYTLVGR